MMEKKEKMTAMITGTRKISNDIYDMWIKCEDKTLCADESEQSTKQSFKENNITKNARPGQFVSLFCQDGSRLLPRPISICEIDQDNGILRLVYRVVGKGTEEFSKRNPGDSIEVMGPLGNGFTLEGKKAILIGGGIGIPPMLQLAKELSCEKQIVLGYRDTLFLNEEFEPYGSVFITTEDGSFGTKGNVIDGILENHLEGDMLYACGPLNMLKGVKAYAKEKGIPAQISMEEHMACGIGACLACVCQSKEKDAHSYVNNKRICKDGPVFYAEEVELL